MRSEATFSPDHAYRYSLLRVWDERLPVVANFGVNPSTADATNNDATIRKDIGFAARHGYGGLLKLNLAAYIATDPRRCIRAADPIGPENDVMHMQATMDRVGVGNRDVWFCWGRNGWSFLAQAKRAALAWEHAKCFGKNPDGTPRHTLMLAYSTPLQAYWDGTRGMF